MSDESVFPFSDEAASARDQAELARLGELDKALSVEALILRDRGQKVCTTDGANSGV
jgi:hypothetical protein